MLCPDNGGRLMLKQPARRFMFFGVMSSLAVADVTPLPARRHQGAGDARPRIQRHQRREPRGEQAGDAGVHDPAHRRQVVQGVHADGVRRWVWVWAEGQGDGLGVFNSWVWA